jgi:hypothetical protein
MVYAGAVLGSQEKHVDIRHASTIAANKEYALREHVCVMRDLKERYAMKGGYTSVLSTPETQ